MKKRNSRLLAAIGTVAWPSLVVAQSVWTGAAGDGGNWNNANNWSPVGVPISSTNVTFNASGAAVPTVTLSANGPAATLLFDAGATNYTIASTGSAIISNVSGITVSSTTSGTETIGLNSVTSGSLVYSSSGLTVTNNGAAISSSTPTLVFGPNTVIGTPGSSAITFTGTGTTTFNGSFTAVLANQVVGGLVKTGVGTLNLSGSIAGLNGGLTLNGGTLRLDYSSSTASKFAGAGGLKLQGGDIVIVPNASSAAPATTGGTSLLAGLTDISLAGPGSSLT